MKKSTPFLLIVLVLLLMSTFACHKAEREQDRIVARIDDFKITFQDFSDQFKRLRGDGTLAKADEASKRAVLNDMIDEQIKLFEAYRLGLDKDAKIMSVAAEKEREISAKALRKQEVDDRFINEEVLQRFYGWSDREVDLRYMKFFAGNTEKGRQAALQRAERIYQQLLTGASFKALAAQFSEHQSARTDSGKYGRVYCFSPEEGFFEHAYSLAEGGVSKPFFGTQSVYIIQVEKIHPVSREPYEKARPEIMENVLDLYGGKINERNQAFNEAVRSEYHFSLLSDQIDFFCQRCQTIKTLADSAGLFSPSEKQKVLCRTDVEETTIGPFFPKVVPYYWSSLHQKRVVEMLLTDLNTNRLVKHKAMQMRLNETPLVKEQYRNWLAYYLKKSVIQQEVIDKMGPSETLLQSLYDQKKLSLTVKKRATVREIFRTQEADIQRVHQLAMRGADFTALQKKYCQNQENRNNGMVGPFPVGMNGKLGELAFSGMRIGEISQPFKYRGGYSIIQLLALEPERVKSFAEARQEIKDEYVQAHWQQKETEWLTQAKKNYNIRIRL